MLEIPKYLNHQYILDKTISAQDPVKCLHAVVWKCRLREDRASIHAFINPVHRCTEKLIVRSGKFLFTKQTGVSRKYRRV